MKLYFDPHSRAQVAKWMLDEAGVDYEIVPTLIREKAHKKPEYLKINPSGKLPALVDGRTRVFENAAICMYVAEKFPEARLAPSVGTPERGRYLSLMVYSTAQLEPSNRPSATGSGRARACRWTARAASRETSRRCTCRWPRSRRCACGRRPARAACPPG